MDVESLRHVYLRRVVSPGLRLLGVRGCNGLARRLGRGVYDLGTPGRRIAEARLCDAKSLEHHPDEVRRLLTAMYEHLAQFWVESLFAKRIMRTQGWRRHVSIEGGEELENLARHGRGCLLTTAYFGNPAVAAFALGQIFKPVHVVVDMMAQPQLREWQKSLYHVPGVEIIERARAGRKVQEVLQGGGAVLMIAEHERPRGYSSRVRFLGRTIRCYPTLARLARWFDVPVAVATCHRDHEPLKFTLTLEGAVWAQRDREDDAALMQTVMTKLERAILLRPEQYLWSTPSLTDALPLRTAAQPSWHSAHDGTNGGRLVEVAQLYGKRIGVVPQNMSKSVGLAKAVSGGQ